MSEHPIPSRDGVELHPPAEKTARSPKDRLWLHVLLFFVTCVTTTFWGAVYAGAGLGDWWKGFSYSVPLMGILLTHEMGHYIAARYHRIPASLPYFIPFPFGLGTLGAVISMRGRIKSRNALVDVGASGPLAGFVVAVIVLAIGLSGSPVKEVPVGTPSATEGNSLFYLGMKYMITGEILPSGGRDIFLNPTALAGWIGLLVTMINLIPVGQLDGGHVAFAYFGDRYDAFCQKLHRALPVVGVAVMIYVTLDMVNHAAPVDPTFIEPTWRLLRLNSLWASLSAGFFAGFPWLLWPGFIWVLKRLSGGIYHPPVGSDALTAGRRAVAAAVGLLFLIIFTPIPMRGV